MENPLSVFISNEEGFPNFIVKAFDPVGYEDLKQWGYSEDFVTLNETAEKYGCKWILIASDGPVIPGLNLNTY